MPQLRFRLFGLGRSGRVRRRTAPRSWLRRPAESGRRRSLSRPPPTRRGTARARGSTEAASSTRRSTKPARRRRLSDRPTIGDHTVIERRGKMPRRRHGHRPRRQAWRDRAARLPRGAVRRPRGRVHLLRAETGIGRGPDNDITLGDDSVSRRHAKIRLEDGTFVYWDLGQRQQLLSGRRGWLADRILEPRHLADGDKIDLGDARVTFILVDHGRGDRCVVAPPWQRHSTPADRLRLQLAGLGFPGGGRKPQPDNRQPGGHVVEIRSTAPPTRP